MMCHWVAMGLTTSNSHWGDFWVIRLQSNTTKDENTRYSRTSMARTLMARLPRLFRTRFLSPLEKNPIAADIIIFETI